MRDGTDIVFITAGNTALAAMKAADRLATAGIEAAVVNARFIKPLDRDLILSISARIPRVITVEENALQGGFGSAVLECLNEAGRCPVRLLRVGIPDAFVEQGSMERLREIYGLDENGLFTTALAFAKEPSAIP